MGWWRTLTTHCYMQCFLTPAAEKGDFVRLWVGGALSENSGLCDVFFIA